MNNSIFAGKRILFVGPVFYSYHTHIVTSLSNMGAQVTFVPERQYTNFHNLCYKRLFLRAALQKRYFRKVAAEYLDRSYDFLLVIRGFGMPSEFLRFFREKNPNAKCIMYQWDSEKANPYIHLRDQFDWVMTFDPQDAKTFSLKLLHLFYHDGYRKIAESHEEKDYDFLYVSSFKKERYETLVELEIKLRGFRFYHFMYLPLRSYLKLRLFGYPVRKDLVCFKTMAEADLLKLLARTKCVIDITPNVQTGMPMRIFESLGAHIPVLTTNVCAQTFIGKKSFIQILTKATDFGRVLQDSQLDSFDGIEKFSIDQWLCNIFTNTGSDESRS